MIWTIILLGLGLRLVNLNQSLWLDEAINVLAVRDYSFYNLITQYAQADFHPPGWFIILWLWTKIFGYSEIAARTPSVILGVINIWIVYLIGKKFLNKKLGLISALILAVNPLHIYYSQEARMYVLAVLAVSISMFVFLKGIKDEKLGLTSLILSNVFILFADYVAYFIFPAQFFLLFISKRKFIKKWILALFISLLLSSWWLPVFISQLNVGTVASANIPAWKTVVGSFDFKALLLTFIKFIIGRISLDNKTLYALLLLPIVSLFTFLIWKGVKQLNSFNVKFLLSWFFIPLMVAIIVSLVVPVYSYFRVLFVLPAFIILIGLGILTFKQKLGYIFLISVFLIEIISTLLYLFNPVFNREDWRGVVDYLNRQNAPIVLFESSGIISPFDYYAKGRLNAAGGLTDFPAKGEISVAHLNNLVKNYKQVYLVDYLVGISDPNRYVAKKLIELKYKQVDIRNFNGVGFVYSYTKNE